MKQQKTNVNTLTVERERKNAYHITTILKDSKGLIKVIFPSMLRQPRKGTKSIIINCNKFNLDWSKVLTVALFFSGGCNGGWL